VNEYIPDRDNLAADALSRSFMMVLSNQQSLTLWFGQKILKLFSYLSCNLLKFTKYKDQHNDMVLNMIRLNKFERVYSCRCELLKSAREAITAAKSNLKHSQLQ
jgi:hypothetical protein